MSIIIFYNTIFDVDDELNQVVDEDRLDDIADDRKRTTVNSDIVCDSFYVSKQIVKNSDVIGLIPESLIHRELERGELHILTYGDRKVTTLSGIVLLAERNPSPAVGKYIELIQELDTKL